MFLLSLQCTVLLWEWPNVPALGGIGSLTGARDLSSQGPFQQAED